MRKLIVSRNIRHRRGTTKDRGGSGSSNNATSYSSLAQQNGRSSNNNPFMLRPSQDVNRDLVQLTEEQERSSCIFQLSASLT